MILLTFLACETFHILVPEDTAVITDSAEETRLNPVADIDWTADRLLISITNGSGYEFKFGLVETSTECSIETQYGCWTAEDCGSPHSVHTGGYTSPQSDPNLDHGSYCHPLSEIGTDLVYSENLFSVINGDEAIGEGKTAFPAPTEELSYEFKVTYYLQATEIGGSSETECWVWGLDPDHFADRNCKVPIPMSNGSTRQVTLELPN
jgi:hypothetical protein